MISEVVQREEEFQAVRIIPVKLTWIQPILRLDAPWSSPAEQKRLRASRLVGCVHYLIGGSHPPQLLFDIFNSPADETLTIGE